jgi:hypothetical protein
MELRLKTYEIHLKNTELRLKDEQMRFNEMDTCSTRWTHANSFCEEARRHGYSVRMATRSPLSFTMFVSLHSVHPQRRTR